MTVQPVFSIIVPTYARPARLQACLIALGKLDFSVDEFEVIVVDDGSSTPPTAIVEEARQRLQVSLIVQSHAGPATARNTGAAQAQGEYLAFTDDDCAPDSNWLAALAARLRQTPDRLVGGLSVNALPENPYSAVSQDLINFLYQSFNAEPERARFFTSNNMALASALFKQIGGFNQYFPFAAGEDRDFCDRWLGQGRGLTFAAEAIIYHAHTLTFGSFWRQHFNYGRGGFQFHRLRSQRTKGLVQLEKPGFYAGLLTQPFRPAQLRRRVGLYLALLTLLSQVATVAGYARETVSGSR
jgi:GT2 family glycosyltransferase